MTMLRLRYSFVRAASFSLPLMLIASCGGSETKLASRRACENLRQHVVALRMENVTADRETHRAAIESALGGFVSTCTESSTAVQVHCALAAPDFQAIHACSAGGAR